LSIATQSNAVEAVSLPLDLPPVHLDATDFFEQFWTAYPRKVGKPAARRAFATACRKCPLPEMGAGLRRWRAYWAYRNEPQFVPHPSTWLNQERWNDDPPSLADAGVAALDRIMERCRAAQ
jgi:hypothetical protein